MNRKALVVILTFLVLAILLPSCSQTPKEVSIGVALSVLNHQAVELALKEISSAGGINGVPIRAVGLDWKFRDTTQPSDIISWAERFSHTPELLAVIGHSDSSSSLSAAAIYNQNHVPQIVTIATSPALTAVGQLDLSSLPHRCQAGSRARPIFASEVGEEELRDLLRERRLRPGLGTGFRERSAPLGRVSFLEPDASQPSAGGRQGADPFDD